MFVRSFGWGWVGPCALFALALTSAQAGTNPCPTSLLTRQAADAPPGFTPVKPPAAPAPLMEMTFFDRDLGPAAALEPDETRRFQDGTLVSTWTFARGNWHPNQIRCAYSGTQIALVKILDSGISTCVTRYDKLLKVGGLPLIRSIDCR